MQEKPFVSYGSVFHQWFLLRYVGLMVIFAVDCLSMNLTFDFPYENRWIFFISCNESVQQFWNAQFLKATTIFLSFLWYPKYNKTKRLRWGASALTSTTVFLELTTPDQENENHDHPCDSLVATDGEEFNGFCKENRESNFKWQNTQRRRWPRLD